MPLVRSHGVTLRASARNDVPFGHKVDYITRSYALEGPLDMRHALPGLEENGVSDEPEGPTSKIIAV
jgi:hypothetical protein